MWSAAAQLPLFSSTSTILFWRASMGAPTAGNNQSVESAVDLDHSRASIPVGIPHQNPRPPTPRTGHLFHRIMELRHTLISLLRRKLQKWYAPIACRGQGKRPSFSGPPVRLISRHRIARPTARIASEMMVLTLISLALSGIAIWVSFRAFFYTKRQTEIMEGQEVRREREDQSIMEWAPKFDEAARLVVAMVSRCVFSYELPHYSTVFSDENLRTRIQQYLMDADFGRNRFTARQANSDQLHLPVVQQTIKEVLDRVKQFRESDPENARKLGF